MAESVVDTEKWDRGPRRAANGPIYVCHVCIVAEQSCAAEYVRYFPGLHGDSRTILPWVKGGAS